MESLDQIKQLIKNGQKLNAWNELSRYLEDNPRSEEAWLLAYSLAKPEARDGILKKALSYIPSSLSLRLKNVPPPARRNRYVKALDFFDSTLQVLGRKKYKNPEPTTPSYDSLSTNDANFQAGGWCLILVVIILFLGAIGSWGTPTDYMEEAFIRCKLNVRDRLRNPRSADFQSYSPRYVTMLTRYVDNSGKETGGRYQVVSVVSAENGFGGISSAGFICVLERTGGNNWQLESIGIGD